MKILKKRWVKIVGSIEYIGSMKKEFWNIPFQEILGKKVANIFWNKNMLRN